MIKDLTIEKDIINALIIYCGLANTSPIMCFSTSDDRAPNFKRGLHFDKMESVTIKDGVEYLISGKFYDHDIAEIKDVVVKFNKPEKISEAFFEKLDLIPKEIKLARCLF